MTPEARFAQIVSDLRMLGVTRTTSFGRSGMMADGKVVAWFLDDAMTFSLGADTPEHERALSLDGSGVWHPGDRGQPFKDWVRIPAEHQDQWGRFAELALHHIRQKL